jgi:hypothetical protein
MPEEKKLARVCRKLPMCRDKLSNLPLLL